MISPSGILIVSKIKFHAIILNTTLRVFEVLVKTMFN